MADDYTTSSTPTQAAEAGVHEKVVAEEVNPHDYRCWEMFKAYRQCICEVASHAYMSLLPESVLRICLHTIALWLAATAVDYWL